MNSPRNMNVNIYVNQIEIDTHNFIATYYVTMHKHIQFVLQYEIQESELYHLGYNITNPNDDYTQDQQLLDSELILFFFRNNINNEHNAKYLYDLCHTIRQNNITFKSIYNDNY